MSRETGSWLLGRNPVREALRAGRPLVRVSVARGAAGPALREITALARAAGVPVQETDRAQLDRIGGGVPHQGVVALAAAWEYVGLDDLFARAERSGTPPFLVLLDGVEDPRNLGSILRTADGAGAHGVIVPARRAAGLTAAVARASAGAVEYVPVARVTNTNRAAEELQRRGVWLVGADAAGEVELHQADLSGPVCIVIGGEGRGLGRTLAAKCDLRVRIPMRGGVTSLNAAVSAALLLYEVVRRRERA